jgi:hypothetical protein
LFTFLSYLLLVVLSFHFEGKMSLRGEGCYTPGIFTISDRYSIFRIFGSIRRFRTFRLSGRLGILLFRGFATFESGLFGWARVGLFGLKS